MINLFFIEHNFSGVRTYTNELLEYLKDKVNVYKIVFNNTIYKEFTIKEENNINVIYIPKSIKNEVSIKYFKHIAQIIYARYNSLNNCIVHMNVPEQYHLALELKKIFECKLIYTLHFIENFYSYIDQWTGYNAEMIITGNELESKILEIADHIICVTAFSKRILINLYQVEQHKIEVIYNGKKESTKNSDYIIKNKEQYGFRVTDRIILYAGQLEIRKGIDKLIKAFLLIKDKHPDTRLVIAGTGNYDSYNQLALECAGKIHFIGKLDNNTLTDFYCFSEIGIIPSQFEQCSYVAIEMMQNQLPLIISNVPGLNELIIHRKTGMVCNVKPHEFIPNTLEADENDLASQITYLLENRSYAAELAGAAYNSALLCHTTDIMGEKTLEVYLKLINKKTEELEYSIIQDIDQ